MRLWKQALAGVLAFLMAWPALLLAQVPSPILPPPPSAPPALFAPEQLEQIAAPIALYPDPLLGQVLMAATYPLEVVQAARFIQADPTLQGARLNGALRAQSWDDSVKSLALFPQVLAMMNDKLDWTQNLGDAFLGQPRELMDAVQRLRARAQAQGTLASTPQQTVVVEQAPQPIIQIVPVNPEIVYVPVYNPVAVYGPWPYPAYPPSYYYPAGWPVGRALFSFGPPIFVGFGLWAICHWHRHVVVIDAPRYHRFTEIVNVEARRGELARVRAVRVEGHRFAWEHNALHRRGVGYRDAAIPQRVGSPRLPDTVSREPFRERGEPARADQVHAPQGRVEPGRVEPARVQSSRTDHQRAQPDWVGRVHHGRAQPPADPPRPGVQAPRRPEADRGQPVSAPRVESAPPAPGQRREPGMSPDVRGRGDARTHGDRVREGHHVIAPPSPTVRTPPPPVSAPSGAVRPSSVASPPSPAASAPAPTGPPARQKPPGGGPLGVGKRDGSARVTTSIVGREGVSAPR